MIKLKKGVYPKQGLIMRYLLLIILFYISLVAYADKSRVASGIYDHTSAQQTLNSLKHYVQKAKTIVDKYKTVLDDYEYMLLEFSRLQKTCMTIGSVYSKAQQWAGCNRDVSKRSNKLRQITIKLTNRLDMLEIRLIRTKYHVDKMSIDISYKKSLKKQINGILKEINVLDHRFEELYP